MRNINRHKSSDKQSIMTKSSFALTILLIVGIIITVGTMILTVFFRLSLPIKIAVSAILIPDSIISMIFTISTAVKERNSTGDFFFGNRIQIFGFCLVMIAWSVIIFLI
nr:hypothetical protein [Ruminococcus bromii]